jgi:protein ImuB
MRILCLSLQQNLEPSCAEIFLKFSPRVQFRFPGYIFIDIESTAGLFGGELQTLKKVIELARSFAPKATAAIADSAPVAQMMVNFRPFEVSRSGEDTKVISKLPVLALRELEGLEAWSQKRVIEHIIKFFNMMGMEWIEDVYHFQQASFRERWGDVGTLLWKRLHGQDFQMVSPLITQEPLNGYAYFDDPVGFSAILMEKLQPQLQFLFHRLEGLGRFAQRIELILHCEYSNKRHSFFIEPVSPSRDAHLFKELLLQKLENLDLENPIREFEIQIYDSPEKIDQLDFFEARDQTEDRWKRLMSLAQQSDIEMGFLQIEPAHLPEESFSFQTDWPKKFEAKDLIQWQEKAIQIKKVHAKELGDSPRPSLLLKEPLQLSKIMLEKMKLLTRFPTERIQSTWWKSEKARDYYFALSKKGQLLWIYQDLHTQNYFLQGYFD